MEIVLQWLDELDDLVFAGISVWRRVRRLLLVVALGTAVAIPGVVLTRFPTDLAYNLLWLSLVALSGWAILAALAAGADRSARSRIGNA